MDTITSKFKHVFFQGTTQLQAKNLIQLYIHSHLPDKKETGNGSRSSFKLYFEVTCQCKIPELQDLLVNTMPYYISLLNANRKLISDDDEMIIKIFKSQKQLENNQLEQNLKPLLGLVKVFAKQDFNRISKGFVQQVI